MWTCRVKLTWGHAWSYTYQIAQYWPVDHIIPVLSRTAKWFNTNRVCTISWVILGQAQGFESGQWILIPLFCPDGLLWGHLIERPTDKNIWWQMTFWNKLHRSNVWFSFSLKNLLSEQHMTNLESKQLVQRVKWQTTLRGNHEVKRPPNKIYVWYKSALLSCPTAEELVSSASPNWLMHKHSLMFWALGIYWSVVSEEEWLTDTWVFTPEKEISHSQLNLAKMIK